MPHHLLHPRKRTTRFTWIALATALTVGLSGCSVSSGPTGSSVETQSSELATALDERLTETLRDVGEQGVQAVLVQDGSVTWSSVRGQAILNVHPAHEVGTSTLFNLGSFGKLVLGAFALAQVEQEVLELDVPIAEYVGDSIAGSDVVTLRMLLSHTSGYGNLYAHPDVVPLFPPGTEGAPIGTTPIEYDPNEPFTFAQLNAGIDAPVNPGTTYKYQDTNYIVLLEVLSTVLGGQGKVEGAVVSFLTEAGAIDSKQGADMTLDRTATATLERFAHGYTPLENDLGLQDYNTAYGATGVPADEFGFPFGDGFLAGNALGVASFLDALFVEGTVLAPDTVEMMTAPSAPALAADRTTGLSTSRKTVAGIEWQGHDGAFGGFTSDSFTDRAGRSTLVVLTNRDNPAPMVAEAIWDELADEYAQARN